MLECVHVDVLAGVGSETHAGDEHKRKSDERRQEQRLEALDQQLPNSSILPFFSEIMNGALGSKSWLFGLVPISDWKLLPLSSSSVEGSSVRPWQPDASSAAGRMHSLVFDLDYWV